MSTTRILYYGPGEVSPPGHETRGKFIQLRWQDQEHLVFAPFEQHRYHNQLLARFLTDHGAEYRWARQDSLEFDLPALEVIGGGRFHLDPRAGTLSLWDESQAYGRFDGRGLEQRIAAAGSPWDSLRVRIDP